MICPFCFKPLDDERVFFLANADADARVEVCEHGRDLPAFDHAASDVADGPLLMHMNCLYLSPLLVIPAGAQQEEVRAIIENNRISAERADRIARLATGALTSANRQILERDAGNHWSVSRILTTSEPEGRPRRMWFPRRLAAEDDEHHPVLTIYLSGPVETGKSFFATMAVSRNAYIHMPGVTLANNFGYAIPRFAPATPAYQDFQELLRQFRYTEYGRAAITPTDPKGLLFRAGFFLHPFPDSNVDTVLLLDLPGELNSGWDATAYEMQRGGHYLCVVISPTDLASLRGCFGTGGSGGPAPSSRRSSIGEACAKMSEFRKKFRRVVIVIPRMDQLVPNDCPVLNPRHGEALKRLHEHLDYLRQRSSQSFPDDGETDAAPVEKSMKNLAARGTAILRELLASSNSRLETELRKLIKHTDAVAFFTGVDGWDEEAEPAANPQNEVRPFGIGEAIQWMAQDRRQSFGGNRFWPTLVEKFENFRGRR